MQSWKPEQYAKHASFVSELGLPVLELLNPQAGEAILDLGCGDGSLALSMQEAGALVLGIDSDASMVRAARSKGIQAYVSRAERLSFSHEFDAVFSNAALHWMPDHRAVLAGVFRALKPGGRFVGEFGGQGNVACLREAMRAVYEGEGWGEYSDPWYFPSAEEYAAALESAGFSVDYIELLPRPTPLSSGVREWLRIFAEHLLAKLNQEEAERFLMMVEAAVEAALYSASQGWMADYVRLRFDARKA